MTKSLLGVGYKDGAKWVNEDANSTQFITFVYLEPFQRTRRKLESAGGAVLDYDPTALTVVGGVYKKFMSLRSLSMVPTERGSIPDTDFETWEVGFLRAVQKAWADVESYEKKNFLQSLDFSMIDGNAQIILR
jgi:hypothetical protein